MVGIFSCRNPLIFALQNYAANEYSSIVYKQSVHAGKRAFDSPALLKCGG